MTSNKNLNGDIFGRGTIWTPPTDRLITSVATWIRTDQPGAFVYGHSRIGKTSAVADYLPGCISEMVGSPVATMYFTVCDSNDKERALVHDFLLQSGNRLTSGRDISVLRHRLYWSLQKRAAESVAKRILIIVDEAQNLGTIGFKTLLHTYNALEALELQPFFLLVGEPQLKDEVHRWTAIHAFNIVGRFFAREHEYVGLAKEEIGEVLGEFDKMWESSGVSFAERLLPEAHSAGWRLKDLEIHFVEAMSLLDERHGLRDGLRIPMQYFRSALIGVLNRMVTSRIPVVELSTAMILECIVETGFVNALGYYAKSRSGGGRIL